jgi:hypothetical protein
MLDRTIQVEAVNNVEPANTEPAVSVIIPCRNERNHASSYRFRRLWVGSDLYGEQ